MISIVSGISFPRPLELHGGHARRVPHRERVLRQGLSSPLTREFSFSVGQELWGKGSAKVTYTDRNYSNVVEDFFNDPANAGRVDVMYEGVDYGTFDK